MDRRRCAGELPHVQGKAGAPPSAEEQQQDKDNIAGDGKKTSGYAAMEQPTGLAAKGATAAERAPTPGVPLLPPTPATHVIDGSWVIMVRRCCLRRSLMLGVLMAPACHDLLERATLRWAQNTQQSAMRPMSSILCDV